MHKSASHPESPMAPFISGRSHVQEVHFWQKIGMLGSSLSQYSRPGMASPFSSSGITCLNSLGFQANMEGELKKVRGGLHVSPRTAPSKRAKLCTYFAWFLRPSHLQTVPYFESPMPISRLRLLMQFRMGSHALPVEQGRLARPAIPRHLRRCTLCETRELAEREREFH